MMIIYCTGCQKDVEASLVTGKIIYPHRPDLYQKLFYKCPHCSLYVGCHPNTENPLGIIPTKEIMNARRHIHALLDPIWKNKIKSRGWCYGTLSKKLGKPYHTGETRSLDECREIYKIVFCLVQELKEKEVK